MPTEQQLFAVCSCIEEYLEAQEALGVALKQGLFSIAQGKLALAASGGGGLGAARYPGDMAANALVRLVAPDDPEGLYDGFALESSSSGQQQHPHQPAAGGDSSGVEAQRSRHSHSGGSSDPLAWFCALPPPPVKQAQRDFQQVLARAVAAANALQQLRQQAEGLQDRSSDVGSEAGL